MKEWRAKALELRVAGKSIRQIATELGYSVGAVHKAIEQEIAAIPAEGVATLRETMGAQLDALIAAHLPVAVGEIRREDEAGGVIVVAPNHDSANVVIKALTSKAKLFGADAPSRTELTGKDGGPLSVDVTRLTDAQLDQLARGDIAGLASESGTREETPSDEPDEG